MMGSMSDGRHKEEESSNGPAASSCRDTSSVATGEFNAGGKQVFPDRVQFNLSAQNPSFVRANWPRSPERIHSHARRQNVDQIIDYLYAGTLDASAWDRALSGITHIRGE
jgi:hypothetical protein